MVFSSTCRLSLLYGRIWWVFMMLVLGTIRPFIFWKINISMLIAFLFTRFANGFLVVLVKGRCLYMACLSERNVLVLISLKKKISDTEIKSPGYTRLGIRFITFIERFLNSVERKLIECTNDFGLEFWRTECVHESGRKFCCFYVLPESCIPFFLKVKLFYCFFKYIFKNEFMRLNYLLLQANKDWVLFIISWKCKGPCSTFFRSFSMEI